MKQNEVRFGGCRGGDCDSVQSGKGMPSCQNILLAVLRQGKVWKEHDSSSFQEGAARPFVTLVPSYQIVRRYISEESNVSSHRQKGLVDGTFNILLA
jgi:hypothetical protein